MNKIISILLITASLVMLTGCNDWLDLYPQNAQTSDQFWRTKEDVESVVAAGYVKLKSAVDEMFVWGEVRGNGIDIVSSTVDDNIKAAKKIRDMDILPTNLYAKWGKMYQTINMANSVIKYAPEVIALDPSFTTAEMNSFVAEAYFQRALAYFYLVRTFGEVPLVLLPYVKDDEQYEFPKVSENVVLDQIVKDLNVALTSAKSFFPETNYDNQLNTKGRATKWAIHSLLADIYLWRGDYDKCIENCDAVIQSGRVGLIGKSLWFTNFFPGNSNESIFEIQYSYARSQTNDFIKWFDTNFKYGYSLYQYQLFLQTETSGDIRGLGGSYVAGSKVWKYIGYQIDKTAAAKRNATTEADQNFIIYRLADIILMKAEALVMKNEFSEAITQIKRVRDRAGIVDNLTALPTEIEMLDLVLNERARELFAEGKRWFDLLRVARRNNYQYKDYLITQVTLVAPLNSIAIISSKLMDVNSHYMPIHQDELNANPLLIQNPYYSSLGN